MMRLTPAAGLWISIVAAGCAPATTAAPPPPPPPEIVTVPTLVPAPAEIPVPNAYRAAVARGSRTSSGAPGASIWQNRPSYEINAEIDPASNTLRGSERVVYQNNSPTPLLSIVLNLYQNVFSEGVPRNRTAAITGGVTLDRVAINGTDMSRRPTNEIPVSFDVRQAPAGYAVDGTLARIRLPQMVMPGQSVTVEVDWSHTIPPAGSFRTAWEDALGSRAFLVAQWYPQIAAYDDIQGWDATPYLGDGEFYLDYGDFDVAITVPTGFLVGATGDLVNPEEVLTDEAIRRLDQAIRSDSITRIVTDADITAENATVQSPDGQLTWRFSARDVRDFAFATSAGYVWDATRARLPDGSGGTRDVAVHSLYRPGSPNWENAAEYGQHSLGVFSDLVVPYPYSQMTIAEGPIGGMEYPMLTFIYRASSEFALYSVIAHELAHEWFPMLVGPDEAAYAWIDEGLATYMEGFAVGDYFDMEDPLSAEVQNYLSVAGSDLEVPLMRHTDLVSPYGARVIAAYSKPAVLYRSLDDLLGDGTFRTALRTFAEEWRMGHPTPWDFFATVERVAGEPLDWFFEPWWFDTQPLDQAIVGVEQGGTGTVVTVANLAGAVAPAPLVATLASGGTVTGRIEASEWLGGAETVSVTLGTSEAVVEVVIDPAQIYPDVDLENNVWTAGSQ